VGHRVYVTNPQVNTLTVIDLAASAVIETIPVGSKPMGVAAYSGNLAFVANQGDNTVSIIQSS